VSGDGRAVAVRATVTDAVRRGAAFLHAATADPLVRHGVETVTVSPVSPTAETTDLSPGASHRNQ